MMRIDGSNVRRHQFNFRASQTEKDFSFDFSHLFKRLVEYRKIYPSHSAIYSRFGWKIDRNLRIHERQRSRLYLFIHNNQWHKSVGIVPAPRSGATIGRQEGIMHQFKGAGDLGESAEKLLIKNPNTTKIININLINSDFDSVLDWLCRRLELRAPTRVAFLNAHCANLSARSPDYRHALETAHAVLPDGSGVALALRLKGQRLAANLNGTDFIPALCGKLAGSRYSVFLFGGRPGIAELAAIALCKAAPGLKIAGTRDGYVDAASESATIRAINASGADIVLVAMGAPNQDLWLRRNAARLRAPLTFGVGGLFDFLSGRIPRAPLWLRGAGLEWTYRLYQEPGRLWRRYILGNPEFVIRAAVDALPRAAEIARRVDSAGTMALNVAGAAIGVILLSPVFLVTAIAVRLSSEGPAILRQTRIGRGGAPFQLYKFRSMYVDAETRRAALLAQNRHGADCVTFKLVRDPRITPLGRFLRRSSIDELPQLFNVLKGDMALVGPRPPLPEEVSRYTAHQRRRLTGKPGLTCLWQISGRANLGFGRQVELDIEYLTHRTLWMDLLIVLRTIPAVILGKGAY